MAGQLDSAFKKIAKQVVADLGSSFDSTIIYVRKGISSYDVETGQQISSDTIYSDLKAPVEFIKSEEEGGQEMREAKIYLTPDLIGDNQPTLDDEIKLTFAGSTRVGQITQIDTKQGGQTYLFTLLVRF
jgi:hypothetical protein|tara:strand:- start:146 stop:532 length:387 start_codon:yes stop_codon:yes gene_type:complete